MNIKVLKTLCKYHCLPNIKENFSFNNFEYNSNRIIKLLDILKDVDSLDRVRIIEPWGIDIKY